MHRIYHDPNNPQCDAVERYAVDNSLCLNGVSCGNDCKCGDNKKLYYVYILRSQLMYDIEAELNIITRSRRNEAHLQDNGIENTDELRPILNRWMNKYISLAKRKLTSVLRDDAPNASTNYIKDAEEIDFSLSIGDWWNENALDTLTEAIHDYIVNGTLYEYLLLYLTAKDPVTATKEQQTEFALENIHNALCSYKAGKLRKGMHPFP